MSEIKNPPVKNSPPAPPKKGNNKVELSFEMIKEMNSLEKSELVEKIKTEFKVGETVAAPQTTASANEKTEEKGGNVSVKVVKIEATGLEKIKAYGAIKDLISDPELSQLSQGESINIVQVKKKTEEGDKIILTNIPSEKAKSIKEKLAEKKVEVEIVK